MVHLHADNLSLDYPIMERIPLTARLRSSPARAIGGRIEAVGGGQVVHALSDISFEVSDGDRLALVGANGAGKSTLLKVLYGIYRPSAGRLNVNGSRDALFNIQLGFRRDASGRRNIELRGLINGWTRAEVRERTDEIIAFSEIGEFIDMPLKLYSQGMAARLAFAIATSGRPDILLMDEWIGAGDALFQKKAKARMSEMLQGAGIIVLASHNASILKDTCTHGLVLDKGRAVFFGPLADALVCHTETLAGADARR